jgi:hypothetical protein
MGEYSIEVRRGVLSGTIGRGAEGSGWWECEAVALLRDEEEEEEVEEEEPER